MGHCPDVPRHLPSPAPVVVVALRQLLPGEGAEALATRSRMHPAI